MPLARREFLLGSLTSPTLFAQKKAQAAGPNIVLIVADKLSSWMLGCYGNKDIRTPHIDLLARGGTRFANAFVSSPLSSPSRATLFTGRLPGQHGIQDPVPPDAAPPPSFQSEILISDMLAAQGYNCGYVGKWDLGGDSAPQHRYSFWHTAPDQIDAKAKEFLDQQKPDQPFLLTIGYIHPHVSSEGEYAQATFEGMGRDPIAPNAAGGKEMLRDVVGNLRKFAAGVSAVDAQIPPLLSKLHERGLRDNTLIVFCGANGYLLGRHGLWSDGQASDPVNMYEEVMEVPMIWNWPGRVPVESVRNELVSFYDVMPTLCEVAGVTPPAGRNLVGRSYAPLAFGRTLPKKQPWRNLVFGQHHDTWMARDSRYKLVLRNQGKGPSELFDLSLDPREKLNQFANPAHISIRDQLIRQIETFQGLLRR